MTACGDEGSAVASIAITSPTSGPLASLGDTLQLTASALDEKGAPIAGVAISFSSTNPAVATVTQFGLVTAVANGTATIHAVAQGKQAAHDVAVAQVVAQVLVTPASIRVPPGETPLFHAVAADARGHPVAGQPLPVWTTTDGALATIAQDGRAAVSASAAPGSTASARATVSGIASTSGGLMTIDPAAVYVESIALAAPRMIFASLHETAQFSASASNPRQGDVTAQVAFTWTSDAPAVAGVSSSGLVAAVGNGTAAISATSNGVSGAVPVSVAQVVVSVSVATATGAPASLASLGETLQLAATAVDAGGSPVAGAAFAWRTDSAAVATVNAAGLLTATGNGTVNVVATSNQVSNPAPGFSVAVHQVIASVSVTPATMTIPRCTTIQYTAVQKDARGNAVASAPPPAWSSSNPAIVSIDANGIARGAAVGGPATITARGGSASGTARLTVDASPVRVAWGTGQGTVNVSICAGQSVIWHNTDTNVTHTATGSNGRPPNTGSIQPLADSAPQLFDLAGSYPYTCIADLQHSGTVTVVP